MNDFAIAVIGGLVGGFAAFGAVSHAHQVQQQNRLAAMEGHR